MTLRQALDAAMAQSPDVLLARLDQQRARAEVTVTRDPFLPKVYGGSGLAKGSGFPQSIEGSAPAAFRADTRWTLFNRPQSFLSAQANEALRSAEIDVSIKQEDVVYRVAGLFLDAELASRSLGEAERQVENLLRVRQLTETRVNEGREISLALKRANVAVTRARQNIEQLTANLIVAETMLGQVLGLPPDDRVHAAVEDRPAPTMPVSEERSIEDALERNLELRKLQSDLQRKQLEVKQYKAERLPKINAVAQYSILTRYNNYDKFFNAFQRHNWQLGASFEIPLIVGKAATARVSQSEIDMSKIRVEVSRTRSRVTGDLRRAYQEIRRAEGNRNLAREDLDVARAQIDVDLVQYDEGRVPMSKVEESRAIEHEKWLAYYSAQHGFEKARLEVLRQTGTLLTALR